MTKKKGKKKLSFKDYSKIFFKVVKPSRLVILIVLVLANTFGWFIFSTKVSTSLDVHVSAWDVLFEAGNSPIVDYVFLTVDNIYPGMTPYHYDLAASNHGEMDASVHYTIMEFTLFGSTYYTKEGRDEAGLPENANDYTSAQLETILANSTLFPFTITMGFTNALMPAIVGSSNYSLDMTWPYESGHDAQDTQLGQQAYTFKQSNPDDPCLQFKIKVFIQQILPNDDNNNQNNGEGN